MNTFFTLLLRPQVGAFLIALCAGAMMAGALYFQYVRGLAPCELCLWQRWPLSIGGVMALLAAFWPPKRLDIFLGLTGVVLLLGAGIAAYHVGVEQHWWAGTNACTSPIASARTVEDILNRIMTTPLVRCDAVAWSFLGISMAGYNALISTALAVYAFVLGVTHARTVRSARK